MKIIILQKIKKHFEININETKNIKTKTYTGLGGDSLINTHNYHKNTLNTKNTKKKKHKNKEKESLKKIKEK